MRDGQWNQQGDHPNNSDPFRNSKRGIIMEMMMATANLTHPHKENPSSKRRHGSPPILSRHPRHPRHLSTRNSVYPI